MSAARPLIAIASFIVLGGGIVMAFFVILSGSVYSRPEDFIWFLQAATSGISGDRVPADTARWTFFSICGRDDNGRNIDCRRPTAALPFDPPRNFQTTTGIPPQFLGTRHYFYLSRFMFAFYLMAVFFAAIAFFLSVLALCTRLGSYLAGMTVGFAAFFQAIAAALMTAWTVQGRRAFRANGQDAQLGSYAFGFTWATFVCYFLCTIMFCIGGSVGKSSGGTKSSYFGRKRSTRSRGSFIDTESNTRVKDEYD